MSNQTNSKLNIIQKELLLLDQKKDLTQAKRVILSILKLLDNNISIDDQDLFQLFTDSDGKIKSNASWFYEDEILSDRRATYKIHSDNNLNLDLKLYGLTKPVKRTIAWVQSLTPNFEDEPFNASFNVGIDFVVPKKADKVIIVLSNNWVIRTLELKGNLTATYQEILSKWDEISNFENKTELHNILWDSFDLQPLNKKFYQGISERFILLRQHLVKENIFDEKHASLFANRLIGRIIFTWFLDKKQIINQDIKYFDSMSYEDDNIYYREKLEKLFFEVLNTPISDREKFTKDITNLFGKESGPKTLLPLDDKTPFLNGGLFEPRENDLYQSSTLSFPKNYFDDLYEFLNGYNFTTDESTSQFQQVAIDPEMLGRIFENLLAEISEETGEQARKAKGAFYTPREIVDYMCKESLKEYLKTKIPEDEYRDQRLYQLIDAPDKDFQDQDHNWRRDWKPYKEDIIKALDELKVLDPACGSGAFPIGMLQLLVRVYERLEARFDPYKTKLGIIEKNIFGVDIEPMAVEIARLRTWLSIIVDEDSDSKNIKPLPNLEFKFVCANSLLSLEKEGEASFGEDLMLDQKLQEIRDAYFKTESLNKKRKLREQYNDLVFSDQKQFLNMKESKKSQQLKTYNPFDNESCAEFFDSDYMFGVKEFNVLIGNPPYIQLQKNRGELADKYQDEDFITFSRSGDIYVLFYEKAIKLVTQKNGIICFITSNKWMKANYGKKLRELISSLNPIKLIDFSGFKVFKSATVDTNILILKNSESKRLLKACKFDNDFRINQSIQAYFEMNKIDYLLDKSECWSIASQEEIKIVQKIKSLGSPLKNFDIDISFGVKTGLNEAFMLSYDQKQSILQSDPNSSEIIFPIIRGRDIDRYKYRLNDQYIITTKYNSYKTLQEKYPGVYNHLRKYEEKLKNRGQCKTSRNKSNANDFPGQHHWLELDNNPSQAYLDGFKKPKIGWGNISYNSNFAIVDAGVFVLGPAMIMNSNKFPIWYLLGLLNSSMFDFLFKQIGIDLGKGYEWKKAYIEEVYIPKSADPEIIDDVCKLTKELTAQVNDIQLVINLQDRINEKIYALYSLTADEIEVIENFTSI